MAVKGHIGGTKGYTGDRIGENIGFVETTYSYDELIDLSPDGIDINKLSKARKVGVNRNEVVKFTEMLPVPVFKKALIDGIGTWDYSVVGANGMELTQQGQRYVNHVVTPETFNEMTTMDKTTVQLQAKKALDEEEYKTALDLLSTSLPSKTMTSIDGTTTNLKQEILKEIKEIEAKSRIPRKYMTLTLSRFAIDALVEYEIGDIDILLGSDTAGNKRKNYWSIGEIIEADVSELPEDTFFMIHCPYLMATVRFKETVPMGWYAVNQLDKSPMIVRYAMEDGYAMAYGDTSVGVMVTNPEPASGEKPMIHYTLPQITVPTGTTIDQAWLEANNGLKITVENDYEGYRDVTADSTIVVSTIDTAAEGLYTITIDATYDDDNATQRLIMVRVSNSAPSVVAAAISKDDDKLKKEVKELRAARKEDAKKMAELEAIANNSNKKDKK